MKKTSKLFSKASSVRSKSSHGTPKSKSHQSSQKHGKVSNPPSSPSGDALLSCVSPLSVDSSSEKKSSPFSFTTFEPHKSPEFALEPKHHDGNSDLIDPDCGIDMFHHSPTKRIDPLSFPDDNWKPKARTPQIQTDDLDDKSKSSNSSKGKGNFTPRMKSAKKFLSPISSHGRRKSKSSKCVDSDAFPQISPKQNTSNDDSSIPSLLPPSASSGSNHTESFDKNPALTKSEQLANSPVRQTNTNSVEWDPDTPTLSNIRPSGRDETHHKQSSSSDFSDAKKPAHIDKGEQTNVVWEQRKDWSKDTNLVVPQPRQSPPRLKPSKSDTASSEQKRQIRRESSKDQLKNAPRKTKLQKIHELLNENKQLKKENVILLTNLQSQQCYSPSNNSESSNLIDDPETIQKRNFAIKKLSRIAINNRDVVLEKEEKILMMQNTVDMLTERVSDLERKKKDVELKQNRLEKENNALKQEAELTLLYLQRELSTAVENVEEVENNRYQDQNKIQELETQLQQQKEEAEVVMLKNKTMEDDYYALKIENEADKAKIKECTLQLAMTNAMVASKTDEVAQMQSELNESKKSKKKDSQLVDDLKLELQIANDTIQSNSSEKYKEQVKSLETQNENLVGENNRLEGELNELKLEIASFLEVKENDDNIAVKYQTLMKDHNILKEQLGDKNAKIKNMKSEFGSLITAIESKLLDLEEENAKLRLRAVASDGTLLVASIPEDSNSELQLKKLTEKNKALEVEIADLKAKQTVTFSNPTERKQDNEEKIGFKGSSRSDSEKCNLETKNEEDIHEVFSINPRISLSETGESTGEDKIYETPIKSTLMKEKVSESKQGSNRKHSGSSSKRWQAMSVGLTEAQSRAKDLQIENLHRAAMINEETIENLRKDILDLNTKINNKEIEYKTKVDELTKEAIACTYKVTVLEKVRKMELARLGGSSEVSDDHGIDSSAIKTYEDIHVPTTYSNELEERKETGNEKSKSTNEEIHTVTYSHQSNQESIHVLVGKIVGLEKEKEASSEKIDSLQSLIDSMYEREKNEKEERNLYINTLREEIELKSNEVSTLENVIAKLKNGETPQKGFSAVSAMGTTDSKDSLQSVTKGNKLLPGLFRRMNNGSKHSNNGSSHNSSRHEVKSDDPSVQKLQRTCRIHEHTIASLTSEVNNLRLVLRTETAKHEAEMESMKTEAELSASKVTILEEQFIDLNKMQEDWVSDVYGPTSDKTDGAKQSIISVDAGYVSGIKADLDKQRELVEDLNCQLSQSKAETRDMKEKLENEINLIRQKMSEGEGEFRSQILAIVEDRNATEEDFKMKLQMKETTIATLEKSLKQLRDSRNGQQNSTHTRRHTHSEVGLILDIVDSNVDKNGSQESDHGHTVKSLDNSVSSIRDDATQNHNINETEVTRLIGEISQLKEIKDELESELEEKDTEFLKLQKKVSRLETQLRDTRATEKSSVLSLRRIGLIQELLDASTRRLNTMMIKLGRDQNEMKSRETNISHDENVVLSVADKVSLLQEQMKVSLQYIELKLANELELLRQSTRGEEESDINETSQMHLQRCLEIQKETMEVLKETEKSLVKQVEEVNQEMKSFNLVLLSKDDVIESLEDIIRHKTEILNSFQAEINILKSSSQDGVLVTKELMQKAKHGIKANQIIHEKDMTIQRLNNVIDEYRMRIELIEEQNHLHDINEDSSDDEYLSELDQ